MRQLQLEAIGSNAHIADEIAYICSAMLGDTLTITTNTTNKVIPDKEDRTFFICANTQYALLKDKIPLERLFMFDLKPTTKFFLDIATIPKGETIYIFNNLSPYIEQMKEDCIAVMGKNYWHFESIAYEELSQPFIQQKLAKAHYIIGVEQFVQDKVLLSSPFVEYLLPDVTIIAGKRTPSIASANYLLENICNYYLDNYQLQDTGRSIINLAPIVDMIQSAIENIITNRINLPANADITHTVKSLKYTFTYKKETQELYFKELTYLRDKLHALHI